MDECIMSENVLTSEPLGAPVSEQERVHGEGSESTKSETFSFVSNKIELNYFIIPTTGTFASLQQ